MGAKNIGGRLRRADLEWFDLEKYEPLSGFKPYEWGTLLTTRRFALNLLDGRTPADSMDASITPGEASYGSFGDPELLAIPLLHSPPTITEAVVMTTLLLPTGLSDGCFADLNHELGIPSISERAKQGAIYDVTVRDLYVEYADLLSADSLEAIGIAQDARFLSAYAGSRARLDERAKLRHAVERLLPGDEPGIFDDVLDQTIAGFSRSEGETLYSATERIRWVSVDLDASDERILSEMSVWLAQTRLELGGGTSNSVSKGRVARWLQHRLLPYLDLRIFATLSGRSLPDALAGDLLFPDADFDRTEKIRKTVRSLADELISPSTIALLKRQDEWSASA